ncbi:extensin-like isoform X2 [Diaphorina citri]|uniref:Extensin-like isoform X1 n=1 Tax=Diaphorina citri TaxID=121845 RepID=A0A3Q0J3G4_DIACI|nr:extensin-like isoform X1 [Diaphorina citri]XP_026682963.1 extensin-like isoform X2 [Diaphorina citri]
MYLFEPLVFCLLIGSIAGQGRRVGLRVRPTIQEEVAQDEGEFYSEEEQPQQQQVLIRQPALARAISSQPRLQSTAPGPRQKTVEESKPAPVQTIRNYNKLNDDGSFTFGYEAADGSFKEETRGTDCVVRGKYGYIDPDGNKREFTYVSGNPCDPNAEKQEQEEEAEVPAGSPEENVPANYPQRPPVKATRRPPPPQRPSTTLFQQQFATQEASAADEEEQQEQQVNIRPRPTLRPTAFTTVEQDPQVFRGAPQPRPTFAPQPSRATVRFEPPATTFRPQIQLSTSSPLPSRAQAPQAGPKPGLDFSAEFKKFQVDLDELSPSRAPKPASPSSPAQGGSPLYQTELVFDPATGQYNTVVFQQVPKTSAEAPAPQRSPFIPQPQPQPQFFSPPRQAFSQPPPSAFQQQQLFQQQQAALQVQQSQQLFEQQQEQKRATEPPPRIPHSLLRQSPQTFSQAQPTPAPQRFSQPDPTPQRFESEAPPQRFSSASAKSQRFPAEAPQAQRFSQQAPPQSFFFVAAPSDRQTFASGQIDTFLRGHNLQF